MSRHRRARPCRLASPRRSRGVAAVEFVIAVPIIIFLMLAVAELGRAFIRHDTLSIAVRDSARYVSEHAINGTTGVVDVSDAIDEATNLVTYGRPVSGGSMLLPAFDTRGTVEVQAVGTDSIEVTAEYHYPPMILGGVLRPMTPNVEPVPVGNIQLRISVTMRAIS